MKQYILRTTNSDGTSRGGFQWNLEIGGETVAPDWNPHPECGGGLHGFLNGAGDGSLADWSDDALWLVVSTEGDIVDLGGKVKFERAITEYAGSLNGAVEFLASLGINHAVIGATVVAGDCGTATAGYRGTATAGEYGNATAGYSGTATAGDCGTAMAGDYGTATAGGSGTATAGYRGTATAGDDGIIIINWLDDARQRRVAVGYIGEGGLKAGVAYRVSNGEFVEA